MRRLPSGAHEIESKNARTRGRKGGEGLKRMSAWVVALLAALVLCSCSAMSAFAPQSVEPTVQQPSAPASTPLPVPQSTHSGTSARGNSSANLLSGRMAMDEAGTLYVAGREHGVYALAAGDWTRLSGDRARCLNASDGRLYYVARSSDALAPEGAVESIISMKTDGSDRRVLLEGAQVESVDSRDWSDTQKVSHTQYTGVRDLTLWGDYLYFIAKNGNAGARTFFNPYEDGFTLTTYKANKSIYRMPVTGGSPRELVRNVGNGDAHLCLSDGGTVYFSTCYDSGVYPYPVVTLNRCGPDGSGQERLYGRDEPGERDATCERVAGLMAVGEQLYVLAQDSEGDFPHARIMRAADGEYALWDKATYHVNPACAVGSGQIVWLHHEGDMVYDRDAEGVYTGDRVESAQLMRSEGGALPGEALHDFGVLPRFEGEFSRFELSAFGDAVYLLTDQAVFRLNAETRRLKKLAALPLE